MLLPFEAPQKTASALVFPGELLAIAAAQRGLHLVLLVAAGNP